MMVMRLCRAYIILENVVLNRVLGQIVNPPAISHQAHVFTKEVIAIAKCALATKHKEFRPGSRKGNIDSSPIAKQLSNVPVCVTPYAAQYHDFFVSPLELVCSVHFEFRQVMSEILLQN